MITDEQLAAALRCLVEYAATDGSHAARFRSGDVLVVVSLSKRMSEKLEETIERDMSENNSRTAHHRQIKAD